MFERAKAKAQTKAKPEPKPEKEKEKKKEKEWYELTSDTHSSDCHTETSSSDSDPEHPLSKKQKRMKWYLDGCDCRERPTCPHQGDGWSSSQEEGVVVPKSQKLIWKWLKQSKRGQ